MNFHIIMPQGWLCTTWDKNDDNYDTTNRNIMNDWYQIGESWMGLIEWQVKDKKNKGKTIYKIKDGREQNMLLLFTQYLSDCIEGSRKVCLKSLIARMKQERKHSSMIINKFLDKHVS